MSIWKHFFFWLLFLVVYQFCWSLVFTQLFAHFEAATSAYPLMVYFKLLSELLIYGLSGSWFAFAYRDAALWSVLVCAGIAVVSVFLTLQGLVQLSL